MYKLEPTTQFKKDFKSIPEDKHAEIEEVFEILSETGTLPVVPYKIGRAVV